MKLRILRNRCERLCDKVAAEENRNANDIWSECLEYVEGLTPTPPDLSESYQELREAAEALWLEERAVLQAFLQNATESSPAV